MAEADLRSKEWYQNAAVAYKRQWLAASDRARKLDRLLTLMIQHQKAVAASLEVSYLSDGKHGIGSLDAVKMLREVAFKTEQARDDD